MQRHGSMSRINCCTIGEMAPISLGIQASSSSNEWLLCIPANFGCEAGFWLEESAGFIVSIPISHAPATGRSAWSRRS
jgi:hypothetical protein